MQRTITNLQTCSERQSGLDGVSINYPCVFGRYPFFLHVDNYLRGCGIYVRRLYLAHRADLSPGTMSGRRQWPMIKTHLRSVRVFYGGKFLENTGRD